MGQAPPQSPDTIAEPTGGLCRHDRRYRRSPHRATAHVHTLGRRRRHNGGIRNVADRLGGWPRERLAERLSAACYGTVLVLAALPLIDADEVSSGLGWELVTGVGVATWVAHLYAEVVGDHLRHGSGARPGRDQPSHAGRPADPARRRAAGARAPARPSGRSRASCRAVGCPSPSRSGNWLRLVRSSELRSTDGATPWSYAAATAAIGIAVVTPQAGSRSLSQTMVAGRSTPEQGRARSSEGR